MDDGEEERQWEIKSDSGGCYIFVGGGICACAKCACAGGIVGPGGDGDKATGACELEKKKRKMEMCSDPPCRTGGWWSEGGAWARAMVVGNGQIKPTWTR